MHTATSEEFEYVGYLVIHIPNEGLQPLTSPLLLKMPKLGIFSDIMSAIFNDFEILAENYMSVSITPISILTNLVSATSLII